MLDSVRGSTVNGSYKSVLESIRICIENDASKIPSKVVKCKKLWV